MSNIDVDQIEILTYISDVAHEIHADSIRWGAAGSSEEAILVLPFYAPSFPNRNVFLSWNRFSGWLLDIHGLGPGKIRLTGFGVGRYTAPEECAVSVFELVGHL